MEQNTTTKLYRDEKAMRTFIGTPEYTAWYINAFKKYDVNGIEKISWNWSWAACFLGPWYLLYRKCYVEGAVLFVVMSLISAILPSFSWLAYIACGGFLPYVLYKKFKKLSLEVENSEKDFEKQLEMLEQLGGVNKPLLYIGIGISILIGLLIIAAIF